MARNNTPRYEPTVALNTKAAENALEILKSKAKEVRAAIREAGNVGDDSRVRKLEKLLKDLEGRQKNIKSLMYDYNTVLKNLNTSSIKDLRLATKILRREISTLTPGTQEFIDKSKQLDLVRARLDQLNGRVRGTHSWLSRAGNSFNKYFGMATAAIASVTGMSFALREASQDAAQMDDIYSDVIKTTGLLRDEVVWLNEEFKKLNTRTSREELNGLARDAGKLGISGKEDVLEFVRAANQINVALREDLGEGAIRNIGKLSEVFKITQDLGIEKSFLSIGSAINALGQASTANEGYLVDFTQRIAGVAYQSGLSIQNVLGFASALDQTGQKVEMSATAFQKFLMKMFSDTATFAKMANMEVSAFSELLRTDVNQAMITLLTELGNKGGFAQLVPIFQDMGLDGARAVSVLSALATNIELVTEAQALSNKEFALATSLTEEYNTKNENMQAKLEKARKAFKDQVIELGEKLSPAFLKTTNASVLFLKALMSVNKELIVTAAVLVGTIVAYKSLSVVMALWNTISAAGRIVSLALSASMAILRGNTIRAAAAWKMLNATMSASAIGLIITAITALGVGLYKLITYQSELTKATKEYYRETEKLKREANDLLQIIDSSTKGSEQYQSAVSKLVDLYGPYISHLIDEKGYLTDIDVTRRLINKAIEETIGLKIKEALVSGIVDKSLQKQADFYEEMVKTLQKQAGLSEDAARIYATNFTNSVKQGANWESEVNNLFAKLKNHFHIRPFRQFANEYKKMLKDVTRANKKFDFVTPRRDESPGETEAQRKAREYKDKMEREAAAAAEIERQRELAEQRQKALEEQFKKELQILDRYEREKEVLLKKKYMENSMSKEEYDALMLDNTTQFLMRRNALYIRFNQDNTSVESAYYSSLMIMADIANKKFEESAKIIKKWLDKISKMKEDQVSEPDIDAELSAFKKYYDDLTTSAESLQKDFVNKSWKKRSELEIKKLDDMLKFQLITHEQYEDALKKLKIDRALEIANTVNSLVQSAADFVMHIQERQYAKLQQEKERELAMHGDSADARAEIENKYEQKKLDIQQKYADLDMGMKIAQAISAGAVAIATAMSQLGAFAAPAIALISATTAMQVATIVAQRNAIKAQSNSSASGGGSSVTVNEFHDGGFTPKDPSDRTPVGVVHANEWVAPASMVRANPLMFAQLESQRTNKYSFHSPPKKYASGGYTSGSSQLPSDISALLKTLIAEIQDIKKNPIPAYVVLSQLNAIQELSDRFKKEGSL